MSEQPLDMAELGVLLEQLNPSDYATTMFPDRPYDGQPHTDTGERGAVEVKGLTFRDLRDCYVRACFRSSGLGPEQWPGTLYDLPWSDIDPLAVFQNLSCEIEKVMGIYPNVANSGFNCGYCDALFICDAERRYECPHDHWQEWVDHLWAEHPDHMEKDGRSRPEGDS